MSPQFSLIDLDVWKIFILQNENSILYKHWAVDFVGNIFQARQGSNDETFDHERQKFTGQSHFEGVGIPEGWDVRHDRNVVVASPQQRRQIILELPGI